MTKAQVKEAVKALGLVARWDSDWQEWIVDYKRNDTRWTSNTSYHTADNEDAIGTAKRMAEFTR